MIIYNNNHIILFKLERKINERDGEREGSHCHSHLSSMKRVS